MSLPTLNSIICVKFSLKIMGKCCNNFQFPQKVLREIKANEKYQKTDIGSSKNSNESCK